MPVSLQRIALLAKALGNQVSRFSLLTGLTNAGGGGRACANTRGIARSALSIQSGLLLPYSGCDNIHTARNKGCIPSRLGILHLLPRAILLFFPLFSFCISFFVLIFLSFLFCLLFGSGWLADDLQSLCSKEKVSTHCAASAERRGQLLSSRPSQLSQPANSPEP